MMDFYTPSNGCLWLHWLEGKRSHWCEQARIISRSVFEFFVLFRWSIKTMLFLLNQLTHFVESQLHLCWLSLLCENFLPLDLIVIAISMLMSPIWHKKSAIRFPSCIACIYHLLCLLFTKCPSLCPVCRTVSCPSRSASGSKRKPGCWRVSSILTLSASMTPGRVCAKERNVLFSSLSSWHLARWKREYRSLKSVL